MSAKTKAKKAAKKAAKVSKPPAKTKNKLKKFVKKAGKKLKSLGQDAVFAPLLPLRRSMVSALDKKNITHDGSLHDVSIKFVKHVVGASHFEEMAFDALYADARSGGTSIANATVSAASGDYVGAAKNLITAIVNYFKKLKAKKEAGIATPEEQIQIRDAEEDAQKIDEADDEDDDEGEQTIIGKILSWMKKNVWIVLVLLGLIVGGYMYFK